MKKNRKKLTKGLQYDNKNKKFCKDFAPKLSSAVEIIEKMSEGKLDYRKLIEYHLDFLKTELSISNHITKLITFYDKVLTSI